MQKRVVLISAAVTVLGLAAFVLGFVAESARSKAFVGYDGQRCVYRRTAAFGCGIAAALLALTGLAHVTTASGCFGRYGGDASAPVRWSSTAAKLSVIAWVLVVAAAAMFLYGAWRNSGGTSGLTRGRSGPRFNRTYQYGCAVVRGGVFATASVATAAATACAVAAYVNLHTAGPAAPGHVTEPGVAMGQPQWSQPYPPPPPAYPSVAYPAPPPYGYGDGYGYGYGAKQPAGPS